ncbi:LrgA family protein [Agrobacterium sp. ATCC 31749]|uniref:CidA/LrgA family protein n=1 Tax=unclassified Agrobacterium TaxID=2632611 RepID=UPI00020DC1F7|nr:MULTISPECIES: CidA/LrgA family protein [unclassified Agrobacterium]EGL65674.1 LrgA family protein [Agrobacterium sp. ATCC 31749]QKX00440.1 CidA/LrgA family protein [Agrobacterium sp. CGMCC 11546]
MVVGITILLVFQLVGEAFAYFLHGVVPGPVIGMALIFLTLSVTRGRFLVLPSRQAVATSNALLANLGILFVPAGVGIVQHFELIADRGLALFATILASTVATLIVTVWCYLATKRLMGSADNG